MQERRVLLRYITFLISVILVFILSMDLAGVLYDTLTHIKHLNGLVFMGMQKKVETFAYLLYPFTQFNEFTLFALIGTACFGLWELWRIRVIVNDSRRKYKQRHGYAAYGTAHWQEYDEVTHYYHQDNNGILLGNYYKRKPTEEIGYKPLPERAFQDPKAGTYSVHPYTSDLNQNYLVFGPPGSKKTISLVMPNIFHAAQQGISMCVTDPKGELYKLTADFCRKHGYRVIVLDYLHFKYGHRQNLLNYIFAEEQYAELANMYLSATRNDGDKRDFWEEKAQELFTALIGFVHQAYGKNGTMADVYRLVPLMTDADYALSLFKKHKIKGAPMEFLRGVLAVAKAENTMANIVSTLGGKLQLFALSNVRAQTAATDFDLKTITDEKTIVYIWMSVSQRTYAPIISAFWTVLFNTMYQRANENGGKLPNILVPLMDEMANIGKIADFDQKLTTMRSLGIFPIMIWHSYPQLKMKYGQDYADTFLGASDTKILLRCGDMQTAKLFSDTLGDTTIETQSRRGSRVITAEMQNATNQFTGRKLLQPSELMSLDPAYSVVIQSGRPPVLLNKIPYQHWAYRIGDEATLDELSAFEIDEDEDDTDLQDAARLFSGQKSVQQHELETEEQSPVFTGVDMSKYSS